jgi:hypothetical protein
VTGAIFTKGVEMILGGIAITSIDKLKEHIKGHYWDQSCGLDCASCGIKTIIQELEKESKAFQDMHSDLIQGYARFRREVIERFRNEDDWIRRENAILKTRINELEALQKKEL